MQALQGLFGPESSILLQLLLHVNLFYSASLHPRACRAGRVHDIGRKIRDLPSSMSRERIPSLIYHAAETCTSRKRCMEDVSRSNMLSRKTGSLIRPK